MVCRAKSRLTRMLRLGRAATVTPWRWTARLSRNASRSAHLATSHLDRSIQGFVEKLSNRQPTFNVRASNIRILQQPKEFYECLLVGTINTSGSHSDYILVQDMISRAEKDIFLSSLYIGSKEGELVCQPSFLSAKDIAECNTRLTVYTALCTGSRTCGYTCCWTTTVQHALVQTRRRASYFL